MALRYSCKNVNVATGAGSSFTHGLGDTPDEWAINLRIGALATSTVHPSPFLSAVGATTITFACSAAAASCDVFAARNHSVIQ